MAELPAIRAEIARARPMSAVYAARADRLGISIGQFRKLVARYAPDAKIRPATEPQKQRKPDAAPARRKTFADHTGIADADTLRKITGR